MKSFGLFLAPKAVLVAHTAFLDAFPSNVEYEYHLAHAKADLGGYIQILNQAVASVSDAELAARVLKHTGLDATVGMDEALAFLRSNAGDRVGAILKELDAYTKTSQGAAYNQKLQEAFKYSSNPANTEFLYNNEAKEIELSVGRDRITGSSADDLFNALVLDNSNTLQSGDKIDGGAGRDVLKADIGTSHAFAVTPETKNVEEIKIRAQGIGPDSKDNNLAGKEVKIDAQRMKDVLNWENNNSRADLLIEDVRINNDQITKDITITMRETDPGHVDYGVYFDQHSLRNVTNSTSRINIQILDTRAAVAGEDNLKGNADWGLKSFNFFVSSDGGTSFKRISLGNDDVTAARTVEQLRDALQKAADAQFGKDVVSVTLGADYTVTDTASGRQTTAKEITLTAKGDLVFDATNAHSQGLNDKSGWTITNVPSDTGLHSNWNQDSTQSTDLVTSTIVLDDVGRGSTGGDLVIGGLSVGDTSTSKGVGRFEITVEDDSKLQTISSTNNTLQEVTVKNGVQDRQPGAYTPIDKAGGKLVVKAHEGNVPGGSTPLPGGSTSDYGFQDVRLIDGSAMTGKFDFTAEFRKEAIEKYLNLKDGQPNPLTEDVKVQYLGGSNEDAMRVDIDSATTASNSKINVGKADFSFTFDGGAGNDTLDISMAREGLKKDLTGLDAGTAALQGNTEAWYNNQKINQNFTVNGGEGNDTIRTPGAGDMFINGGAGNDAIYVDNTGAQAIHQAAAADTLSKAIWVFNTADNAAGATAADRNIFNIKSAAVETKASYGAQVVVNYRGLKVTVALDDKTDYSVSDLDVNQAIKKAINEDPVLSKLLVAQDNPAGALGVQALIDGVHDASDLTVTIENTITAANDISDAALAGFNAAHGTPGADKTAMLNALKATDLQADYTTRMGTDAAAPNAEIVGANSTSTSDNVVEGGAGDDVIVLGTTVGADALASSNDTLKYTGVFGNDTIVNFKVGNAAVVDADKFDFGTLHKSVATVATTVAGTSTTAAANNPAAVTDGQILLAQKSGTGATTAALGDNHTADDVKQLFNDGSTAAQQLYIAIDDAVGTGTVYQVVDGAGTGDLQVTLLGSITLATDAGPGAASVWSTLDAANFA